MNIHKNLKFSTMIQRLNKREGFRKFYITDGEPGEKLIFKFNEKKKEYTCWGELSNTSKEVFFYSECE